nr:phage tail tape measure protein [Cupriavidus neocaledonicus]
MLALGIVPTRVLRVAGVRDILAAAELADNMGKVAGLFKIPIPAIGELADAINYLDDNAISKGGDIIEFLTRTGGVAAAVKVTGQQMAALGSTLLTLGERTETASTATNALFQKLAAADKGTKKFKAAMKEIGLSTAAVQKGMQVDAQGTILKVLEAVNKLPKDKQLGVMVELVGLEHSDTLAKLANNVGEYRRQIELATSAEAKGSMSREFEAQRASTLAQWQLLQNRVTEVSVNIGSVLLPAVNRVMGAFASASSSVADFVRENRTLVENIGVVVGAFAGFGAVKLAITGVTWAVTALNVAVRANPIGILITLLAAGAMLVWKNWEPIKAFFVDLWGSITKAAQGTWDWLQGVFFKFHPLGLVIANWEPIRAWFQNLWADITASARQALEWITGKIEAIGQGWQKTKSFFGFGDSPAPAAAGPAPALPAVPPMATARGAGAQVTDQRQYTFDIKTQPGQDNKAIADEVMRRIKSEQGIQRRGAMYDGANQ